MQVIWRSAACWVVHKPAGLATQAPPQYPSLESQLRQQIAGYLALPHRLDRPVSGCVLVALTKRAARLLSQQFESRKVIKHYLAWVSGEVAVGDEGGVGVWRDSIRKIAGQAKAEIVSPGQNADRHDAQLAVTHVRVLRRRPAATLLLLQPETGRMHQLRLQCAARGWPIVGDRMYGSQVPFACQQAIEAAFALGGPDAANAQQTAADGADGMAANTAAAGFAESGFAASEQRPIALHAYQLQFADPVSGKATPVRARPPWDGDFAVPEAAGGEAYADWPPNFSAHTRLGHR